MIDSNGTNDASTDADQAQPRPVFPRPYEQHYEGNDMADESERVTPLSTITRGASTACRNAFDTTTLALTDMEQPNIAYGRFYIRLDVAGSDFLPLALARSATPSERVDPRAPVAAVHIGAASTSDRLAFARGASTAELLRNERVTMRDPRDQPRPSYRPAGDPDPQDPDPEDRPNRPPPGNRVPVIKATTLGLFSVVGWVPVPPGGTEAEPPPEVSAGLYIVQRYRLATYARGFGLGDHLYSFTLFPEEEVEIEIKTWKSQEQVDKTGSSIFDGQSDTAEATFEDAVQSENSQSSKKDKSFEAHVEASGEASWGFGSASVQAGAKRSTAESAEQFAKNVSSATQKVANKANRERKVEVTQSSEVKTTEGEETRTKRRVRNINKCNTLNFNYFQLVRKYETRLELYDVKVRYSSGRPYFDEATNTWQYEAEEVPLAQCEALLARVLIPASLSTVRTAIFSMLGAGEPDDPGLDVLTPTSTPDRMRLDSVPLAVQLAWEDEARAAANRGEPPPPRPTARLPRVMSRDERVIATNAMYTDAMLGKCPACDDFIQDSRVLEIEGRQLENRERALGVERLRLQNQILEADPIPRRVFRFEGLPENTTVHVKIDDRDEAKATVVDTTRNPTP